MAKYMQKPVVVDAVKYEFGMEDGFHVRNYFTNETLARCATIEERRALSKENATVYFPVIRTAGGYEAVKGSCYIVTGENSERSLCAAALFEATHDKIEPGQ